MKILTSTVMALTLTAGAVFAAAHATPMVEAADQDVSGGIVTADKVMACLLYTSPSPRDVEESRMPSSA